jgi:peptidyl-prolyl cis-trans isomerase SurA
MTTSRDYYRDHLEEYDPLFREQLQEFADGNLLFEVMEKKVWNKAAADTAGLKNYYQQHKSKYIWAPSVNAIIFNASDTKTATDTRKLIEQHPSDWRSVVDSYSGRIMADSSRLEISQLNEPDISKLKPGFLSSIQENETDRSASFYYVVHVYTQTTPRQFEDARGMVMNDYQQELEEKWIAELKKKYPVNINQQEWAKILGKK